MEDMAVLHIEENAAKNRYLHLHLYRYPHLHHLQVQRRIPQVLAATLQPVTCIKVMVAQSKPAILQDETLLVMEALGR